MKCWKLYFCFTETKILFQSLFEINSNKNYYVFWPFSFSAWNSAKKKKKSMTLHRCLLCSWIFWWIVFWKGTSPQPTYITPDFYIPLIHGSSSPWPCTIHWALYMPPKDSSISFNKTNTHRSLESIQLKMFLWGRGKFKSKLHIIFELWKIQFL